MVMETSSEAPTRTKRKKKVRPNPNLGEAIARLLPQLAAKAKSTIRDLDPTNELKFLRLKSKHH